MCWATHGYPTEHQLSVCHKNLSHIIHSIRH